MFQGSCLQRGFSASPPRPASSLYGAVWPTWALTRAQRRQSLGNSFCPPASTRAQRRRQAGFTEQFLPIWASTGGPHRHHAVNGERFGPPGGLMGSIFGSTWTLRRGRQAVFSDQFLAHRHTDATLLGRMKEDNC